MGNRVHHTAAISDAMFLKIWEASRSLPPEFGPKAPGPADQLIKVFNSQDPRAYYNISQKLRQLETHYAWSPDICRAAHQRLRDVKETGAYVRYLREIVQRWLRQFPWLSLVSLGLAHGARLLLSKLENDSLGEVARLVNDINWRCMSHGEYADFFEAHSHWKAPDVDGVNFVGLSESHRRWSKFASGVADADYTLDGVIIGAAVGGPLVKGAQWLLGEAASATAFRVLVPSF